MAFKMNTGEMDGEKIVYRSMSLTGIAGDAGGDELALVAEGVSGLVSFNVEQISLQRTELLEL
jgi:hypothetical protein